MVSPTLKLSYGKAAFIVARPPPLASLSPGNPSSIPPPKSIQFEPTPSPCDLGQIGDERFDIKDRAAITGDAALLFSAASIEVDYEVTQERIYSNLPLIMNDNIAVVLSSSASSRKPTHFFIARADETGRCQTVTTSAVTDSPQCSSKVTSKWSEKQHTWKGKILVPVSALVQYGVDLQSFSLRVARNVIYAEIERPFSKFSTGSVAVAIQSVRSIDGQQYAAPAVDFGRPPDLPEHRIGVSAYAPISVDLLAAATFSDDSGQLLTTRQTAVNALSTPLAKAYACNSCGSYQNEDTQPFQSPITSTTALGINLTPLGVDQVPFNLKSASFPIDSGYKLILAPPSTSPGATTVAGIAAFNGTTKSQGVAHDADLSLAETIPAHLGNSRFELGFFQADANRSQLPTPAPSAYPTAPPALLHTSNGQLSLAYSFSPGGLHAAEGTLRDQKPSKAFTTAPITYSTLFRYGTQYTSQSHVIDIAESFQRAPPALNPSSTREGYSVSGAGGYRNVEPLYNPIDGTFDQHFGEHSPYASVALTHTRASILSPTGFETATLSLSAYSFSDGVRPRDRALLIQGIYPLSPLVSLQSNDTFGSIAISQVGRANNILVSDAAGGSGLLPNNQYNLQLSYGSNTNFQFSLGYSFIQAQGCNTKFVPTPQPCYAYRSPTAVGDLEWSPFPNASALKNLFVQGSLQGSTTTPFQTTNDSVLQTEKFNYYQTTVGHVVRSAVLGVPLLNRLSSCANLLLSAANRGGDLDRFEKSAPIPGFTETASIEYVPGSGWPAFVSAYSRIFNITPSPPSSNAFLFRVQLGLPNGNFARSAHGSCQKNS